MASTYTTSLKIQQIGNGEQAGTWGSTTNTNWTLIEQAVAGVQTITMSNANYTLSNLNGTLDEARNAVLVVTGTNSGVYQVVAPLATKTFIVSNQTTGGYAITIGGASGSIVTVPNGVTTLVYCDGTNFYSGVTGLTGNQTISGNLTVTGTLGVTGATTLSGATALNGTTTAVTPTYPDNSTKVATTAYVTSAFAGAAVPIPSGSVFILYQASAPTGWTQVTSLDDYSLRITSSTGGTTGGTTAFSTVFANQTPSISVSVSGSIGATTLSTGQMPSHNHGVGFGAVYGGGTPFIDAPVAYLTPPAGYTEASDYTGGSGSHTHSFSGSGSGTSSAITLNVRYANVIICSKN